MKVVQYTVNVGHYDDPPRCPAVVAAGVEYLYLADDGPDAPPPWRTVRVERQHPDPRHDARRLRIQSVENLPECDVSIQHDGSITLRADPLRLVETYLADGVAVVYRAHPTRDTVKQEVEAVRRYRKDLTDLPRRQYAHYLARGFPDDVGLSSSGLAIYRHTDEVAEFQQLWWAEVEQWSHRDQLSLDYVRWLTGIETRHIPRTAQGAILSRRKHRK